VQHRMKYVCWMIVGLVLVSMGSVAQTVSIQNVSQSDFSTPQWAQLMATVDGLQLVLGSPLFGSQKRLGEDGWTARDFAVFTAGALTARHYEVLLVENGSGGSPWVAVGLAGGSSIVWIAVDAQPSDGPQTTLGRIPATIAPNGISFDAAYAGQFATSLLPPNASPIAHVRANTHQVDMDSAVRLVAVSSYDLDGVILLYRWTIGSTGQTVLTTIPSLRHTFEVPGDQDVRLTVVDNLGAEGVYVLRLTVVDPSYTPPPSSPGCGCGG